MKIYWILFELYFRIQSQISFGRGVVFQSVSCVTMQTVPTEAKQVVTGQNQQQEQPSQLPEHRSDPTVTDHAPRADSLRIVGIEPGHNDEDGKSDAAAAAGRHGWSVQATSFAHNTINPIRRIIEQLKIEPNPAKFMIPLSIGESCIQPYWLRSQHVILEKGYH